MAALNPGRASDLLKSFETAGFKAMLAGGCVRDKLLGLSPKDFDIATSALPHEVTAIVHKAGWKSIPTGLEHGTITIVTSDGSFECTTLRKDVKTYGRHAEVVFEGATFEDDAQRRDFTINALFEDPSGAIHDFVGGEADIKSRVLKFVGDPAKRIQEDYLRILRFYRFWARLGFQPDLASRVAAKTELDGLTQVSMERINSEMWDILSAEHAPVVLEAMHEDGTLKAISCEGVRLACPKGLLKNFKVSEVVTQHQLQPWFLLTTIMGIGSNNAATTAEAVKLARHWKWSDDKLRRLQGLFEGWGMLEQKFKKTSDKMAFIDHMDQISRRQDFLTFFCPVWDFVAKTTADKTRMATLQDLQSTESTQQVRRTAVPLITGDDLLEHRPDLKGKDIGAAKDQLTRDYRDGLWETREEGLKRAAKLKV